MMFAGFFLLLFKESLCIKPNIKKLFVCSIIAMRYSKLRWWQERQGGAQQVGVILPYARGFHLSDWDLSQGGTCVTKIWSQINRCSRGQKQGQDICSCRFTKNPIFLGSVWKSTIVSTPLFFLLFIFWWKEWESNFSIFPSNWMSGNSMAQYVSIHWYQHVGGYTMSYY